MALVQRVAADVFAEILGWLAGVIAAVRSVRACVVPRVSTVEVGVCFGIGVARVRARGIDVDVRLHRCRRRRAVRLSRRQAVRPRRGSIRLRPSCRSHRQQARADDSGKNAESKRVHRRSVRKLPSEPQAYTSAAARVA